MKILARLEKNRNFWFLLIISLFFFLLRFPSLFEPYWYGDEGIYQTIGLGIDHGRILYKDIFDNKPPLLYLLYAIFNSDQFLLRLVSLIFGVLSVLIFFKLVLKITENKKASYIATFFFTLLFGLPLIEGNIANSENFMLLLNISAGFLAIKSLEMHSGRRYKMLVATGALLSISFLFKIVGLFDFAAIFMFLFFTNFTKNFKDILTPKNIINELKNLFPLVVGFAILPLIVMFYFLAIGAFPYFLQATLLNNVNYVGYGNKFIIPQGLLILKLVLLFGASSFIFLKRKTLGNGAVFAYLWVLFSLFNAFFSQRPYTHYVLIAVPAVCLLIGLTALKNKYFKFNLLFLGISLILLITSFTYYIKTIYYYQNFIAFVSNQKTTYQYQRFFDGNTPNDYTLASYINMYAKKEDNIFIWGNNAQIYKLTNKLPPGRYTVAYHITNYRDGLENTEKGLSITKPKFIIIMGNVPKFSFSLSQYIQRININGINIYERLY